MEEYPDCITSLIVSFIPGIKYIVTVTMPKIECDFRKKGFKLRLNKKMKVPKGYEGIKIKRVYCYSYTQTQDYVIQQKKFANKFYQQDNLELSRHWERLTLKNCSHLRYFLDKKHYLLVYGHYTALPPYHVEEHFYYQLVHTKKEAIDFLSQHARKQMPPLEAKLSGNIEKLRLFENKTTRTLQFYLSNEKELSKKTSQTPEFKLYYYTYYFIAP